MLDEQEDHQFKWTGKEWKIYLHLTFTYVKLQGS